MLPEKGTRMTPVAKTFAVGLIVLFTGATTVFVMRPEVADLAVPDAPWVAGASLDGRVFYTVDRITGTDETLTDELHFRDGTFQSAMCQEYCDFGWSDYREWQEDGVIHFTATTICPDEPHTVVWHGQVTGDEVTLEATWTTRRWYWTRQMHATGAGSETPPPGDAAG
jgi:hypothetical protein